MTQSQKPEKTIHMKEVVKLVKANIVAIRRAEYMPATPTTQEMADMDQLLNSIMADLKAIIPAIERIAALEPPHFKTFADLADSMGYDWPNETASFQRKFIAEYEYGVNTHTVGDEPPDNTEHEAFIAGFWASWWGIPAPVDDRPREPEYDKAEVSKKDWWQA